MPEMDLTDPEFQGLLRLVVDGKAAALKIKSSRNLHEREGLLHARLGLDSDPTPCTAVLSSPTPGPLESQT